MVSKLLEVFVFPRVSAALGAAAERYAATWEEKNRPYRIRRFAPDSYSSATSDTLSADDALRLSGGRALLFVHGTFGRAHSAFDTMPVTVMKELDRRYSGRVFAFDHFTISEGPLRNAERFVEALPPGARVELDLLCHSRGGLVGRAMSEQLATSPANGGRVSVKKVLFAGVPNAGCVLADAKSMSHLIDRYTTWAAWLPTPGVVDVFEGVLSVVKQFAVGVFEGLTGLTSMDPGGAYLKRLNAGAAAAARYFALAANYDPRDPNLRNFFHNAAMDQIFQQDNDLVVPTASVWDANGAGSFPILDRHVFAKTDGVDHGGYFSSTVGQERILSWLTAS